MKTPTVMAKELLAGTDWINKLYIGSIPANAEIDTNQTTVLIQEYLNEPVLYANTKIKYWRVGVEVQVFWTLQGDDFQNREIDVAVKFNQNEWKVESSRSRIKDPDTQQWTKTYYFSKIIKLKEGN